MKKLALLCLLGASLSSNAQNKLLNSHYKGMWQSTDGHTTINVFVDSSRYIRVVEVVDNDTIPTTYSCINSKKLLVTETIDRRSFKISHNIFTLINNRLMTKSSGTCTMSLVRITNTQK